MGGAKSTGGQTASDTTWRSGGAALAPALESQEEGGHLLQYNTISSKEASVGAEAKLGERASRRTKRCSSGSKSKKFFLNWFRYRSRSSVTATPSHRAIMGADLSTERVTRLTAMGFSLTESHAALQATSGNVEAAAEILIQRREQRERDAGGIVAVRINELLRDQRPWPEFFARFLWPEHISERIQTNLVYYRAKCAP